MTRALLVIDVQAEYDDGALPIAWPPVDVAVANVRRAVDAAVAAGVPVVVVQQTEDSSAPAFARGGPGWQLHPTLHGVPADHVVEKQLPSAFSGTGLHDWLQASGIDAVTVVGFLTHNCVDSSVREALHRGYRVEVLDDATGTVALRNAVGTVSAEQLHRHTLLVLQSRFAGVVSTDDWIAGLDGGAPHAPTGLLASAAAALAGATS